MSREISRTRFTLLGLTKSASIFISIGHIAYCLQTPLFSPHADHGNHQQLESRRVNLSPRYSTGLSGDQNCTVDPAASHATIYQTPPLGQSSHFSPHASRGNSVDGFPFPPPQRAQPGVLPHQMSPRYPYTQAPSTTGFPTAYDFQGCYNSVPYGPPIPPYYPYMQPPRIGAPVAFDFQGDYNTLSHGPPIIPHYPYTQASATINTSLPMPPYYLYTQAPPTIDGPLSYNFPGDHNTEVPRGSFRQYNTQVKCHSMYDSRRARLLLLPFVFGTRSVQSFQPVQGSRGDPIDLTQQLHVAPLPLQHGDIDASSKSKKCVRNCPCPAPGCQSFGRPQELRPHISIHLPHWLSCPDPGCSWRGDRLSVFRKHWGTNHPSSGQDLDDDQFII